MAEQIAGPRGRASSSCGWVYSDGQETKPADHFDIVRNRPPEDPTDATFTFEVTVGMPVCRKCTGLSDTMADEEE